MSDDPELTAEQEAQVTRLLAAAGGAVPTPPGVADRLDRTLAGLVEERAAPRAVPATRRRWPRVLLAAAAVVVAGYGVGNVVTSGSVGGDAGGSADSSSAGDAGGVAQRESARLRGVPSIDSDRLEAGVERVLRQPRPLGAKSLDSADLSVARQRCRPPVGGPGTTWYLVRLDGRPASLVGGPVRDGRVRARLWSCGGALLAETSIPDPEGARRPAAGTNRP